MALVQNAAKRDNPSEWLYKDKSMLGAILGWTIYNALIIYFEAIIALGRGLH
jgi:hypothetical protein